MVKKTIPRYCPFKQEPVLRTKKEKRTENWKKAPATLIKKENQIILIYNEIQSGAVAKSYMRKGFLIYEEMRKYIPIYEEAVSHIWLATAPFWIFLYMRKILFLFYQRSVWTRHVHFCMTRHHRTRATRRRPEWTSEELVSIWLCAAWSPATVLPPPPTWSHVTALPTSIRTYTKIDVSPAKTDVANAWQKFPASLEEKSGR